MTLRDYLSQLPQNPYRVEAPLLKVREKAFRASEIEGMKSEQIYCVMYRSDNPVRTEANMFYIPVNVLFTQKPERSLTPADDDMQALFGFLVQELSGRGEKLPQECVNEDEKINKQKNASVYQVKLSSPLLSPDESRDIPGHLTCQLVYNVHYMVF